MISCDEATTISDKKQYKEANLWERLKMSFHIMMCKSCYIYNHQNELLTKIIDIHEVGAHPVQKLKEKDKGEMQNKIDSQS